MARIHDREASARRPPRGCARNSWLNLIDRWFGKLTDKAIRRGVFHSVPELINAIETYLTINNENPEPFIWTATAEQILTKVQRGRATLNTITT